MIKKLAMLAACLSAAAFGDICQTPDNLIANCGFETGDFTGWTTSPGFGAFNFVTTYNDGFVANSGSYFAALGSVGSDGYLSQTLNTTPGAFYNLTWYLGSDGGTPNDFGVYWDCTAALPSPLTCPANTVFYQADIPSTIGTYTEYTFQELAIGNDTITFGSRNDPGFLALDSISVDPMPEPSAFILTLSVLVGAWWWLRRKFSSG